MTLPFVPDLPVSDQMPDWHVTAFAWRGACLDIFSRAEHSIDDCLEVLEGSGGDLGQNAHHHFSAARANALRDFLAERSSFTAHAKPCVEMLDEWCALMQQRVLVAHGRMAVSDIGLTLRYREHRGKKGVTTHEQSFSRLEMLGFLKRISEVQRRLHMQLGQIKAAARRGGQNAA